MSDQQIPAADPHPRRRVLARDVELATVDTGEGDPVVFPARQSHLVVPVAQRDPPRVGDGPLPGPRPAGHGRLGPCPRRDLPLRGPCPLPGRLVRRPGTDRERHPGRPRLGFGPGVPLGPPQPRTGQGHRLHGGHRPAVDVGRVARAFPRAVPVHALTGRRADHPGAERVRRAHPAGQRDARTRRAGDGGLPPPLPGAGRIPTADPDLAPTDSPGRRTRRRGGDRRCLFPVAVNQQRTQAVRQRRPGHHPHRSPARILPRLAQPDRGNRPRLSLHPGRLPRRNRAGPSPTGWHRWASNTAGNLACQAPCQKRAYLGRCSGRAGPPARRSRLLIGLRRF